MQHYYQNSQLNSNTGTTGGAVFMSAGTLLIDPSLFKDNRGTNRWCRSRHWRRGKHDSHDRQESVHGQLGQGPGRWRRCAAHQLRVAGGDEFHIRLEHRGVDGRWAISVTSGNTTITQSTISRNQATNGGGIEVTSTGPSLKIYNSTIAGNTATAASSVGGVRTTSSTTLTTLSSTIIAANTGVGTPDFLAVTGAKISGVDNLIGVKDASWTMVSYPNQIGVASAPLNPGLNAPAQNGGFTLPDGTQILTMSIQAGSAALDTGNNLNGAGGNDQRGAHEFPRDSPLRRRRRIRITNAIATPECTTVLCAADITAMQNTPHTFQVHFFDTSGFVVSTFDNAIEVTGIGYAIPQGATTTAINGGGNSYTVTYSVNPPTGGWGGANMGDYLINVKPSTASDDSANFIPGRNLGAFKATITNQFEVDEFSHADDGLYGNNQLSLREAINLANLNAGFWDTITFDSTGSPAHHWR